VVRRLSLSSSDRGAQLPVYAAEPSASAGRAGLAAGALRGTGGSRRTMQPARAVPSAAFLVPECGRAGARTSVAQPRKVTGIDMPSAAMAASLGMVRGGAPGPGAPRHAGIRRAGCRPAGRKMVCKGHPCIYTADGDSMTQFAFPKAVPCGRRRPRKLTDVHGREG
jgi:hypothetical protein